MSDTFYPTGQGAQIDWNTNILNNSALLGALGFTAAQVTSITNDCALTVYLLTSMGEMPRTLDWQQGQASGSLNSRSSLEKRFGALGLGMNTYFLAGVLLADASPSAAGSLVAGVRADDGDWR